MILGIIDEDNDEEEDEDGEGDQDQEDDDEDEDTGELYHGLEDPSDDERDGNQVVGQPVGGVLISA